jgi:hypothetical protein
MLSDPVLAEYRNLATCVVHVTFTVVTAAVVTVPPPFVTEQFCAGPAFGCVLTVTA